MTETEMLDSPPEFSLVLGGCGSRIGVVKPQTERSCMPARRVKDRRSFDRQ
jgi:hypothetical protein